MNSPELNLPKDKSLSLLVAEAVSAAPLPESFYLGGTIEIAKKLLGKVLVVRHRRKAIGVELVEVEVYLGHQDPASHSYRGLTKRNWPMFEAGGTCYVYLSYGLNYCMNVSTQKKGCAEAILLRAAAPRFGAASMLKNRALAKVSPNLLNGPGKLCQALGIDLSYNGQRYDQPNLKLIDVGKRITKSEIGCSPRIGITKAADDLLRFYLKGSPWLSRKHREN